MEVDGFIVKRVGRNKCLDFGVEGCVLVMKWENGWVDGNSAAFNDLL